MKRTNQSSASYTVPYTVYLMTLFIDLSLSYFSSYEFSKKHITTIHGMRFKKVQSGLDNLNAFKRPL